MLLHHEKTKENIKSKDSLTNEYMKSKILILDNDQDTVDFFCYLLEQDGYDVIGSTQSCILTDTEYIKADLILMDTWIHGNSSGELCKWLKSDPKSSNIPILLTSTDNGLAVTARESLANGYIEKPFDLDYLSQVIKEALKYPV